MDTSSAVAGVIFIIVLFAVFLGPYFNSLFDHKGWDESADPDFNATIVDISSKRVKYAKNDAKFKTTIKFSDGFYYITHKTDREQHLMTYTISITPELRDEIIQTAVSAHHKAVTKKVKHEP